VGFSSEFKAELQLRRVIREFGAELEAKRGSRSWTRRFNVFLFVYWHVSLMRFPS